VTASPKRAGILEFERTKEIVLRHLPAPPALRNAPETSGCDPRADPGWMGFGPQDESNMRPTGGGRPAWPVLLAWALWLLAVLALAAVPWLSLTATRRRRST
jgi:hypothetical protein